MPKRPLLFLDIDGVLCIRKAHVLEPEPMTQLQRICRVTHAEIVLSSDWRRSPLLTAQATEALADIGATVTGATPCRAIRQPLRPLEIKDWIVEHDWRSPFAVVDDRALLEECGGEFLSGRFVQCDPRFGLDRRAANQLIRLLQTSRWRTLLDRWRRVSREISRQSRQSKEDKGGESRREQRVREEAPSPA